MNKKNIYSDEYLHAYIDGELGKDECAQILSDEQHDTMLTQRINEIRLLKEKVQLAFHDASYKHTSKHDIETSFISRNNTLVAGLLLFCAVTVTFIYNINNATDDRELLTKQLISNTPSISASDINQAIGENRRVIIHVSQNNQTQLSETIKILEKLLQKNHSDKAFNIEIIANGQGVKALDATTSHHAKYLAQLSQQFDNLDVVACAKSMAKFTQEGHPLQIVESITIMPSAIEQIATRITQGWLYLKL